MEMLWHVSNVDRIIGVKDQWCQWKHGMHTSRPIHLVMETIYHSCLLKVAATFLTFHFHNLKNLPPGWLEKPVVTRAKKKCFKNQFKHLK